MPLDNLRAIYERLFRDGVMVAKKDKRPQEKHPEIPGVGNLQVIRAMGSLKSRGFVRETFAWRHFYWYLTNEGIVYLRDYLHLPPEIVPSPLQRVRRPAATLSIGQRAARVQAIEGPTSYVPKPGRVGGESQEALLDRQVYRHKRMQTEEESMPNEKTPRFRGRPISVDYNKSRAPVESRDQAQSVYHGGQDTDYSVKKKITTTSHQPPAKISSTSLLQKMSESYKGTSEASLIENTPKIMVNVDLPAQTAFTAEIVEVKASMSTSKTGTAKEDVCDKALSKPILTKTVKDTSIPPNSKEQVEQAVKVTKSKNTQENLVRKIPENTETCISTSSTPQSVELKRKTKASEEPIISKTAKGVHAVPSPKEQIEKSLGVMEIKNICENPVKNEIPPKTKTRQELITSESPEDVFLSSHSKTPTKTQHLKEHPVEEKVSKNSEKYVAVSSTLSQPVELKTEALQEPVSTNPTTDASVIPYIKQANVVETGNEQEHPVKMPKNAEMCISSTTSTVDPVKLKANSKASEDLFISKPAKETLVPLSSKKQVEKIVKVTKTKTIQTLPVENKMTEKIETHLSTSTFQPVELKTKANLEVVSSESPVDTSISYESKKQEEKTLKVTVTKSPQEHLVKDEITQNKTTDISMSTSTVQELKPKNKDLPDLGKSKNNKEMKEEIVPHVSKLNENTKVDVVDDMVDDVVDFVKEKVSLEERTGNADAESAVPPAAPLTVVTSNVQKSKKSQKTSSIKETKDTSMTAKNIKPIQVNAPKEEEIPARELSTTAIRTESEVLKHDTNPLPEISNATALDQATGVIIHEEIKVVELSATKVKKTTKHEKTSIPQSPPPINLLEDLKAKDLKKKEEEAAPNSSKRKKKKQTAANKVPPAAAKINATEEMVTAQVAVKIHPNQGSEPSTISETPEICPEESSQATAVQSEAPIHKGEVEPAQPSAEKIKREVLKGKTSSSQQLREAPTAQASAAAQAGPYPEYGEPPSVAQHSAAPDTQCRGEKKNILSVSKAVKQPVTTGPLSAEENQELFEDEAAMRKKIVVVEEVIEVQQQIASPSADESQPAVPSKPEIPGDDLDYDVLEELAKERAVFPVEEVVWDHSLIEPEPKTFPNFIEGMLKLEFLLPFVCMCNVTATVGAPLCLQCGRVRVVSMKLS